MSKLVVNIRDDDKNFPLCPLEHEGYCHLPQTHYRLGNALYMTECLGIINKRPPWCPLKEEKVTIPVEWIREWISERNDFPTMPYNQHILNMLEDWEKENAK